MAGGSRTVNVCADVAVPAAVLTVNLPLPVAPVGMLTVTAVEVDVKLRLYPLHRTPVVPDMPVPVIVTVLPAIALVGETPVTPIVGVMPRAEAEVAVPELVVTTIEPVMDAAGTVLMVICVALSTT